MTDRFFIYHTNGGWFASSELIKKGGKGRYITTAHPLAHEVRAILVLLSKTTPAGRDFYFAAKTVNASLDSRDSGLKAVSLAETADHHNRLLICKK